MYLAISVEVHNPALRHNKLNWDCLIEGYTHHFIVEKSESKLHRLMKKSKQILMEYLKLYLLPCRFMEGLMWSQVMMSIYISLLCVFMLP